MSYSLFLHELEHGVAVLPGPLPPNAGQSERADAPPWWAPSRLGRWPYPAMWSFMDHYHEISEPELVDWWGPSAIGVMHGIVARSGGAIDVFRRGDVTVYRLRFRVTT